jgi:hypothetical protein
MFAAKLKAAGRLTSVGEKCPFFDVMIGAIESESDAGHMTTALVKVSAILELEGEYVRVAAGNQSHPRLIMHRAVVSQHQVAAVQVDHRVHVMRHSAA